MDIQRTDLKVKAGRRRITYAALAIAAVSLVAVGASNLDPAAPSVSRAELWVDTVRRGELLHEVRAPGTLVPKEIRWIAAQSSARVDRILVRPGSHVDSDTVILELSNPDVIEEHLAAVSAFSAAQADRAAQRMTLESRLLTQRARLAGVEADLEGARLQAEAERELVESKIIPAIQARRSELALGQLELRVGIEKERVQILEEAVRVQLQATRTRVEQLHSTAEMHKRRVEALRVKASHAGVLQQVSVEEGQQVAAGANLARVARPGQLMAALRVPEVQVKEIALDQQARIDTRNGIVIGRVTRIDPAVVNGAVLVEVGFTEELPASARPELSVDGAIEIERLADVVFVGRPAHSRPQSDAELFRVDADGGIAERVAVRFGRGSSSLIEVARGLNPGDQVILSDTSRWGDQDRLKLN
jgi:HlyD family secretion protein